MIRKLLISVCLFVGLASICFAQDQNGLRFLNTYQLQVDPQYSNSDDQEDTDRGESTETQYETPQTFSGVQIESTRGRSSHQYQSVDQLYNVNRYGLLQGGQNTAKNVRELSSGTIPFPSLPMFGAELFVGNFTGTYYDERNPSYVIRYGDRVGVRVWGAFNFEQDLTVDLLGNIFIPSVGPIKLAGVPNESLSKVVRQAIARVYSEKYLDMYIDLLTSHPLSVFVTGFVDAPGRYAGGATDSVLFFLDLAGGINPLRGSYRDIEIVRKGVSIGRVDLYEFMRNGQFGEFKLQEGDVIVVKERGIKVGVNGQVRTQAWFEFPETSVSGAEVIELAMPLSGATHVSIHGYRRSSPMKRYMTLEEFKSFRVMDEDTIEFLSDKPSGEIVVYAEGALKGRSQFFVKKGTKLHELMNYVAVDKDYANLKAIYLKRVSVARQQAAALADSLFRLQQDSLTASSQTVGEATIRVKEAELINKFVEHAKKIHHMGVVAISNNGVVEDVFLQDRDIIVIPTMTDVVVVAGQVVAPNTLIYNKNYQIEDYLKSAGGISSNGDPKNILVFKADGHIIKVAEAAIEAGDTIMVLPMYKSKNLEFARALTEIFYQLAVGSRAILTPLFQ